MTDILPVINLVLIVIICIIAMSNFWFLHKHRDDKSKLKNEATDLYPLVDPEFYKKTLTRQTVENNQEIQEQNGKMDLFEERLEVIEEKLGIKG